MASATYIPPGPGEPEEWRPIDGYEGIYEVSDLGRVRRLTYRGRWGERPYVEPRVLKHPIVGGYRMSRLCKPERQLLRKVSGLVARAFHGPRPPDMVVAHLDGNCQNDRASNVAYATQKENYSHSVAHGTAARGEKQGSARLTTGAVLAIRQAAAGGGDKKMIAERWQIHRSTVERIHNRKAWAHLP